jgi:hypothetical protein
MCETCVEAATKITVAVIPRLGVSAMGIDSSAPGVTERTIRLGERLGTLYKQVYAAVREASGCEDQEFLSDNAQLGSSDTYSLVGQ